MINFTTKAGGLRLTAENKMDQLILAEIRSNLTRCYSNAVTVWVPKNEIPTAEAIIKSFKVLD